MKAYQVHDGEPGEHSEMVFAHSAQEAKKVAYRVNDLGCDGFTDMRATRLPEMDRFLAHGSASAYVESRNGILRRAGWSTDGDHLCCQCDLATMDGDFPLCAECERCAECGHEEGCREAA